MRRAHGFSLIEILTALIIFGILCAYGLSFLSSLMSKNQHEVVADEIIQAIQFAKIEALTHARVLALTPISEDDDWSKGMRLFEDNKAHRYEPQSTLIREWRWGHSSIKVTWHGFESTAYLRFTPDLLARSANGKFVVQDGEKHQITLVINRLGRVKKLES